MLNAKQLNLHITYSENFCRGTGRKDWTGCEREKLTLDSKNIWRDILKNRMLHLKLARNTQLLSGEKLETLKHCQRRQQFTDLVFICEDNLYFAHKIILASVSSKARYLILDQRSFTSNIFLPGAKPHDVENLICLLYSGEIWLPGNEVEGLLKTAKSLGIDKFEPHGELEIPVDLLYREEASQTMRNAFKESKNNTSQAKQAGGPSGTKVPSTSKNDQENRETSNSSNYTSFSDPNSTLPSSIASSVSCYGVSRTFIKPKSKSNSSRNSNRSRSSRPEHLRRKSSDMLNMNLLALSPEEENYFGNANPDFTFTIDSPLAKGGRPKTFQPTCVGTPLPASMLNNTSESSDEDSFPGATSVWDLPPVPESALEITADASMCLTRMTRSRSISQGGVGTFIKLESSKGLPKARVAKNAREVGVIGNSRGTRAAKLKALDAIHMNAIKSKRNV